MHSDSFNRIFMFEFLFFFFSLDKGGKMCPKIAASILEQSGGISFHSPFILRMKTLYLTWHEFIDTGRKLTLNAGNSGSADFVCEITLFEDVTFVCGVVVNLIHLSVILWQLRTKEFYTLNFLRLP